MSSLSVIWICLAITVQFTISVDVINIDRRQCLYEYNKYDLKRDTAYQVEWDGRGLPTKCRQRFVIPDSNKVTVEATRFYVMDCDFNISYVYNSKTQHNFSCSSRPRKIEIEDIGYFYLYMVSSGRTTTSNFVIKITLEDEHTLHNFRDSFLDEWTSWLLVLLLLVAVIVTIHCLRRKEETLRKIRECCCDVYLYDECERRCNSSGSSLPPPPPASPQPNIYFDCERPPPSYEDCVNVDESPPPYTAST